jgi:beta-aspartyl-peptidase (threonine type)
MVNEVLVEAGGSGGIVALDRYGNIAMPFNTKGMYRGYAGPDGREVLIFKE